MIKLPTSAHFLALVLAFSSLPVFAGEIIAADKVVPELVALGLKPKVEKLVDPKFAVLSHPSDRYYLAITIGQLTPEQFAKIHAMYGGLSQVPYQKGRVYDFTDFLPPAIQAVSNQTFADNYYSFDIYKYADQFEDLTPEQEEKMSEEAKSAHFDKQREFFGLARNGIGSFTNCWNTTIEILNSVFFNDMTYDLYWPGRWEADSRLRDDANSEIVKPNQTQLFDALLVNMKLADNDGDLRGTLQHSALVINPYLLFEKTDGSSNDPYRLSLREDVELKYREIFKPEELIVEYRRFGKAPLPSDPLMKLHPDIIKILKVEAPGLNVNAICTGCETALGGGCSPVNTEKFSSEIKINPATGRGILKAPQKLLKRFSPLRGR